MDSPETQKQATNPSIENNESKSELAKINTSCRIINNVAVAEDEECNEPTNKNSGEQTTAGEGGSDIGCEIATSENRNSCEIDGDGQVTGSSDDDPKIEIAVEENECDISVSEEMKHNSLEISKTNYNDNAEKQSLPPASSEKTNPSTPASALYNGDNKDDNSEKKIESDNFNKSNSVSNDNTDTSESIVTSRLETLNSEISTMSSTTSVQEQDNVESTTMEITSSSSIPLSCRSRTTSSSSSSNKEPTSVLDIIRDDTLQPRRHPSEVDDNSLLDKVILYSLKNNLFSNKSLESRVKDASMSNCFNTSTALCSSPTKTFNITTNVASSSSASGNRKVNDSTTSNEIKTKNCDDTASLDNENRSERHNSNFNSKCNSDSNDLPSTSSIPNTLNNGKENIDGNNQSKVVSASDRTSTPEDNRQILERQLTSIQVIKKPEHVRRSSTANEQSSASLDLTAPHRNSIDDEAPPPRRNSALYVRNPDFSRQIFAAPGIPSASSTNNISTPKADLSQLHMKTPDFSKASRPSYTTELQIQNPDFTNRFPPQSADNRPSSSSVMLVDANNFAEIRQRNNYISDLQLKNPGPVIANTPTIDVSAVHSSTPVQKAPDKIVRDYAKEKIILEEPTAHVIHKNHFLVQKESQPNTWESRPHIIMPTAPQLSLSGNVEERINSETSIYSSQAYEASKKQTNLQHMPSSSSKDVVIKPNFSRTYTTDDMKKPKAGEPLKYSYNDHRHINPAHYHLVSKPQSERNNDNFPGSYKEPPKDARNPFEYGPEASFSLKYKEQQLRQEGTIITIKPEPVPNTNNAQLYESKATIEAATSGVVNIHSHNSHMLRNVHRSSSTTDGSTIDLTKGQVIMTKGPDSHHYRNESYPRVEIGKTSYPSYSEDMNRHSYKHPSVMMHSRSNTDLGPHGHHSQPSTEIHGISRNSILSARKSSIPGPMQPPQNWPPNQTRIMLSPNGSANMVQSAPPQSPAFLQPSPKPSPSPTHFNRMANPSPTPSRSITIHSPNQLSNKSTPSPSSFISTSPHQMAQPYIEQKYSEQKYAELKSAEQKLAEQKYSEQKYAEQKYAEQKYMEQMHYYNSQHSSPQTTGPLYKYPVAEKYVCPSVTDSPVSGQYTETKPKVPEKYPQKYHAKEDTNMNVHHGIKYASSYENLQRLPNIIESNSHRRIPVDMHPIKTPSSEFQLSHGETSRRYSNLEFGKTEPDLKHLYTDQDSNVKLISGHVKYSNQFNEVHHRREQIQMPMEKSYKYSSGTSYPRDPNCINQQEKYEESRYVRSTSVIATGSCSNRLPDNLPNRMEDSCLINSNQYTIHPHMETSKLQKNISQPSERVRPPESVPPIAAKTTIYYPEVAVQASSSYRLPMRKESQPPMQPHTSQATPGLALETCGLEENRIKKVAASQQTEISKVVSSTFKDPVKRESPLDLSVKTVKTKADSTGCDDSSLIHSTHKIRNYSTQAPKVEFAPNFSKRVQPSSTPQVYNYDPRTAINVAGSSRMSTTKDVRPIITSQIHPPHLQGGSSIPLPNQPNIHRIAQTPQQQSSGAYEKRVNIYPVNNPRTIVRPEESKVISDPTRYNLNCTSTLRKEDYDIRTQYRADYNQHFNGKPQHSINAVHNYTDQLQKSQHPHLLQQQPSRSLEPGGSHTQYQMVDKTTPHYHKHNKIILPSNSHYYQNNSNNQKLYSPVDKNSSNTVNKEKSNISYPPLKSLEDQQRLEDRKYVESILYNKKGTMYPSDMMLRSQYDKSIPHSQSTSKSPLMVPPRKRPQPENMQKDEPLAKQSRVDIYASQSHIGHTSGSLETSHLIKKDFSAHADYYGHRSDVKDYHSGTIVAKAPVENSLPQHVTGHSGHLYSHHHPLTDAEKHFYDKNRSAHSPQMYSNIDPTRMGSHTDPKYTAHIETEITLHKPYHPSQRIDEKVNYLTNSNEHNHQKYASYTSHPNQVVPSTYTRDNRDPGLYASNWYPPASLTGDMNKHYSQEVAAVPSQIYSSRSTNVEGYKTQNCLKEVQMNVDQYPKNEMIASHLENRSSTVAANLLRGADQNVISKLRNSLELKEIEKQKSQMRKQNSSEVSEDDGTKADMAQILAARIRTKGELKGFTPTTNYQEPIKLQEVEVSPELPTEIDGPSAFDLMDWGTACNEFVEQLQTGKKRGRRKRGVRQRSEAEKRIDENVEKNQKIFSMLPGNDSKFSEVPKEVVTSLNQKEKSSSDEDKPLLFLRQQTVIQSAADVKEDFLKNRYESNKDDSTKESSATMQSIISRSNVVERLSEKIARNMREKQRLEKEQRIAARLGKSSSSDSEPEPRTQRTKKRARKLRPRSSLGMKNSSDDNTDDNENDLKDAKRKLTEKSSSGFDSDIQNTTNIKHSSIIKSAVSEVNTKKSLKNVSSEEEPNSSIKDNTKRNKTTAVVRKVNTRNSSKAKASSSEDQKSNDSTEEDKKKGKSLEKISKSSTKSNIKEAPKNVGRGRSKSQLDVPAKTIDDIETMTRSKTKLEMEKKMSNSKILRNEKVVLNTIVEKKAKIQESSSKITTKPTANKKDLSESHVYNMGKRKLPDSESETNEVISKSKKNLRLVPKEQSSSESQESSDEDILTPVIERLRSRKTKTDTLVSESKRKSGEKLLDKKNVGRSTSPKKGSTSKTSTVAEPKITKFVPGWEAQVIEFKRKLKIPDSLITVARPTYHRGSTSLPDLDPQSSDTSENFSVFKSRMCGSAGGEGSEDSNGNGLKSNSQSHKRNLLNKFNKIATASAISDGSTKNENITTTTKSIIDVLHQRVINPMKKNRKMRQIQLFSEPKIIPKGNENELLPTPGAENDEIFNMNKTHFKTSVLSSRTRTEQRVQKSKELIREVFGGEDRPASAPPLVFVNPTNKDTEATSQPTVSNMPLTFNQHYEDMLRKMNIDFDEKIRKNKNKTNGFFDSISEISMKTEKFDDDEDEETQDTVLNCDDGDTPSIASERDLTTPVSFKNVINTTKTRKSRGNRAGKRKGSSGFDYIRKKKKPPIPSVNQDGTPNLTIPKRRAAAVNFLQEKDENDISREIKGWVPNKSIGESVMHKASRLGYVDVIAFCLDRLDMHPDQKDNAGYTPLHEACSRGHLDISRLLLQFGANHSETAQSGIRPLHEAVENGHMEVVRLLLAYGADPLLSTYSGSTPIQLAETPEMTNFIQNYLDDIQSMRAEPHTCWPLTDLWKVYDPDYEGCDAIEDVPDSCEKEIQPETPNKESDTPSSSEGSKRKNHCDSNSNIMHFESPTATTKNILTVPLPPPPPQVILQSEVKIEQNIMYDKNIKYKNCTVVLNNIDSHPRLSNNPAIMRALEGKHTSNVIVEAIDVDSGTENLEFEESDSPLPPIYLLKDEGQEKWVLLSDLCTLLKVKSKDAVLKQICPSSPLSSANKELLRELKMSDFLEKAICLQLLCAGEKLNIRSSKVILVRYNESVQNLLGVQTIVMKI